MASFFYFATLGESFIMLADVLSLGMGLKIIHDPGAFPMDQPQWHHSVDPELAHSLEDREYFAIGGDFTKQPLVFIPPTDKSPGYGLLDGHGGPVLTGNLARVVELEGAPTLTWGEIGYQPHYLDTTTGTWDPPAQEVKDAYRAIVRCMKRHLLKRRLNESFWIGPEAWKLWQAGQVRFLPWGAIQDGRGKLPFPFPPEPIDG